MSEKTNERAFEGGSRFGLLDLCVSPILPHPISAPEFRREFRKLIGACSQVPPGDFTVSISSATGLTDLSSYSQFGKQTTATAEGAFCALKPRWLKVILIASSLLLLGSTACFAQQVTFKRPDLQSSISVAASQATRWQQGHYEVLHLLGDVQIRQQGITASGNEAILWVEIPADSSVANGSTPHKIIAYLEGQTVVEVSADGPSDRIVDEKWLGRFFTNATVDLNLNTRPLGDGSEPAIFSRAQKALAAGLDGSVVPAGFATPQQSVVVDPATGAIQTVTPSQTSNGEPVFQPPGLMGGQSMIDPNSNAAPIPVQTSPRSTAPGSNRSPFKINITSRDSTVAPNAKSFKNPQNANEFVTVAVGGIRIAINSPDIYNQPFFQGDRDPKLYILADNMVNWQFQLPDGSKRDQFYLEGNVVFAKGSRTIYADRMFYDADAQRGTILDAEVLTTVPDYAGAVRLKAEVVEQYDENNLQAFGSAFTSSRLGVPRYWLQSESVAIQGIPRRAVDPATGLPKIDPETLQQEIESEYFLDAQSNRVFLGGVPVFAWPRLRTSLSDQTMYLERLGVNNDRIFGFQLNTGWNMYQLFGIRQPPKGTNWVGILDYLSDRGIAFGSDFEYERDSLFGVNGPAKGHYKSWFINDDGLDFLGLDRRDLVPEKDNRGRIWATHQHDFGPGFRLRGELGYISDRNFLEQYYEREWDTQKDATTGLWLERNQGTQSNNLTADLQINDFFTQTSGIKYDQFVLGQPVFNNRGVWHSHTHAGYLRMRQANAPTDPVDLAKFDPLGWEADVDGFRVGTRHEIDFPQQFGPFKVIPYGIGDVTYWQEDLTGNDLTRAYGQIGIKASLPVWRVNPSIQSVLWNVNGLAHKVNFDLDAFYADASQDLTDLPLYDQLDDDSQEHFRRRFAFDTFGILPGDDVPLKYDERYFALRSGMQGYMTAPSTEIADDLAIIKLGVRQRWQTKRGLPGRERIIDWMTLDMQTILFPDSQRDNFGNADFGMFDYDFRWHIGDRFSVVSDGFADFFSQGLRTVSVGANIGRPEVGNAYVGYRMIEGPISSNILSASMTYRMSDKWGVKLGGQVDFGETGTIGQTINAVYIGESFLWQFGTNYDVSRDNLGFRFGVEPRFIKNGRLFRPGGVPVAPAGSRWLE